MINVNCRKPIKLKNRTNYFDPNVSRTHVTFMSPLSYQSRQQKIEGYETRLYWEFRYCLEHQGQTFFYTLTYNDSHLPKFEGQNCFDYNDLVYLLNGGFKKQLLRKYGTNFKYFVGAELGDGKGSRGMHNNPHYHVLFFLRPANDPRYPYKVISPFDFRRLVRLYWQGFDESETGYQDYNTAKFGIAREGQNIGLVSDFRACMYCAKYVCKDAKLKKHEKNIRRNIIHRLYNETRGSWYAEYGFFNEVINPRFNFLKKCTLQKPILEDWFYSPFQLLKEYIPEFQWYLPIEPPLHDILHEFLDKFRLYDAYRDYVISLIEPQVRLRINEFRNRYSNKARISQGVGVYALEFIKDKMNPLIPVPSKNGFKYRPLSLYYYRKLFTEVVYDSNKQPLRILNPLGMRYKLSRLPYQIRRMKDRLISNLSLMNESFYNKMVSSDVNTDVSTPYSKVSELLKQNDINDVAQRYAEFKLVYENRFFQLRHDRSTDEYSFPDIDITSDYKRFITPTYYTAHYNPFGVSDFLESNYEGFISYIAHPYFLQYSRLFLVFDLLSDYLFVKADEQNQRKAEEIAEVKRFHSKIDLVSFYSKFKLS